MQAMTKISSDVHVTGERFPSVGCDEIDFLRSELPQSSHGRTRLCVHKENADRLHEMFISFTGNNYVRPSLHRNKDESLHVVDGSADYVFFDGKGNVTDVVGLGPYGSERQFYCRIPANTYHALVIRSEEITVHETTVGPFDRKDTVFAGWSPDEHDGKAVREYISTLLKLPAKNRPQLAMDRMSEEAFVAAEPIVSVGRSEIDLLKRVVSETTRKRIRLCAHRDVADRLHEMFVVYMDMTYVKPNKHLNKDESLHILEGEADFIFFDEIGNITAVIPLGDRTTGRKFYIRVPAFVYHTLVMRSERLVIHEATPGPFVREDTVWAPWAPDERDAAGVEAFMSRLRQTALQSTG